MKKLLILLLVTASAHALTGVLVKEWTQGDTRFCQYRDGTATWVVTHHKSQPCDINSRR